MRCSSGSPSAGRVSRPSGSTTSERSADRTHSEQRGPAAKYPVSDPAAENDDDGPGHRDADDRDHQQAIDYQPQQGEPEGADLPAKMRFQPGAGDVAALQVIEKHRAQRGQAENETAGDGRRRGDADQHGDGVQAVDEMGELDQRRADALQIDDRYGFRHG